MFSKIQDLFVGYTNIKLLFYIKGAIILLYPASYNRYLKRKLKKRIDKYDKAYIQSRVNYYNKLNSKFKSSDDTKTIEGLSLKNSPSCYFFDAFEIFRFFKKNNSIKWLFGDVIHIPDVPTIVKSRPINGNNNNSIILKLDKNRHFKFIKDHIPFENKKSMLVARGMVSSDKPLRYHFLKQYFGHPLCDVGKTNQGEDNTWLVPYMSISKQLEYKFILCWEGVDVASNLKWVMSSNSLAVSTKPKYETWFMEGQLIPNYHYVEVKDDFSDLIEKMDYYSTHKEDAKAIIKNANNYVAQFKDKKCETLLSILVLEKYFSKQL